MLENTNQKMLAAIEALIIIFLVVVGIISLRGDKGSPVVDETKYGLRKDVPAGQLASGFPKEYILDSKAVPYESYSIPYKGAEQLTANFVSDKTIAQEYKAYIDFLELKGYQILKKENDNKIASIYALSKDSDVNVNIYKDANTAKTTVVVSYLKH